MALSIGQKRRKGVVDADVKSVRTQTLAESLWNATEPKLIVSARVALLEKPEIWQWIKPLYNRDKPVMVHKNREKDHEYLIKNSALSDQDLAKFGVAENEPLKVLVHPECGDECLKIVAKLWECGNTDNINCVTSWASEAQINRMYALHPSCKHRNATLGGYAVFSNGR